MSATDLATGAAQSAVDPRAIEAELARLWSAPAGDATARTRACMSNLLIFCDQQTQAAAVGDDVAQIVQQHPARVLLMVAGTETADADIEAFVAAQCHRASDGTQVCSEHVTITTGTAGMRRMPSVARALLLGDLPTALWWASPQAPSPSGTPFAELAAMSKQVIYDSSAWDDPLRGMVAVSDWLALGPGGPLAADLAWRRLFSWRQSLAQVLDPLRAPGAQAGIVEVDVTHGLQALPQAWLLLGWLADRLQWKITDGHAGAAERRWNLRAGERRVRATLHQIDSGGSGLQKVVIAWEASGQSFTATVQTMPAGHLEVATHGADARLVASPLPSRADLIAGQMPELRGDSLFADALHTVRGLARALG